MPSHVLGFSWYSQGRPPIPPNSNFLLVMLNYLIVAVIPPRTDYYPEDLKLDLNSCPQYARKVDNELYLNCMHPTTGDFLITGKDKILRRYKQPDSDGHLSKLDLRVKIPSNPPLEELDGHALAANVLILSPDKRFCVSGAADGTIFLRDIGELSSFKMVEK